MGKHEKEKPPIDWPKLAAIITVIEAVVKIITAIVKAIRG